MRKWQCVVLAGVMSFAIMNAEAFDGRRKGFQIGGGIGGGLAKVDIDDADVSEDDFGIATTFKLGGGITDQFSLYYCNRVVFYKMDDSDDLLAQGLTAVALTYYLNPEGSSVYFSGEMGLASAVNISDSSNNPDPGFGFSIGAGYEFSPHYAVELNYMTGSVDSEGFDIDISNITLSFVATAF